MNLSKILAQLEELGIANDSIESDKSKKYLNITRDTGEFLSVLFLLYGLGGRKAVAKVLPSAGDKPLW